MPFRDDIDAIDERVDAKVKPAFVNGVVVSVTPRYVYIRVAGSSRNVKAYYNAIIPPAPGEKAMAALSEQQNRYVLMTSFTADGSRSVTNRRPEEFALAPPSNVAAVAMVESILVQWDDPIAQSLAFEVQTNTSAADAGATSHIVTRGSILIATASQLYARVRSVTAKFQYSSWSAWVDATPMPLAVDYASLTDVDMTGLADGNVPVWDAATSKWVPGTAGGSFSGTAFDVPYTPTNSGDWSPAPTDVGAALDQLATGSGGSGTGITVSETDGTPLVTGVTEIQVANTLLTDLGGGVVSISRSRRDLYGEPDGSLMSLTPNYWQEFDGSSLPGDWSIVGSSFAAGPTADAGRSCVSVEATTTHGYYEHVLSSPISGDLDFETKTWLETFSTTASSNGMEFALRDSSSNIILSIYFYHLSSQYYYQAYSTFTGTSYSTGSMQLPLLMSRSSPYYFKFTRVSGLVSAYHSVDGENWNFMASKSSVTTTIDRITWRPYKQAGSINTKARIFYSRINS